MRDISKVFVTGITGYVGGSIAVKLQQRGYQVLGLARKPTDIAALKQLGFDAVEGSLQDESVIRKAIQETDAVVHTADSDDLRVADLFLSSLKGTGKTFIYTSGSAIVANWEHPETASFVFTEDYPLETTGPMGHRVAINNTVLRGAIDGVRTIVVVPSMVYGTGLLLKQQSTQVPAMVQAALDRGEAVYAGGTTQSWSNVHIEDLCDLYIAALERAKPGSYFFAENGMASFKEIAGAIQTRLGFTGEPALLTREEAAGYWGEKKALIALGSDCRLNADKARLQLEWKPQHTSVLPFA